MKAIKILMMGVLTITIIGLFAQEYHTANKHSTYNSISGKTIYTCPMHSQIAKNKSGRCSICGMDLEKSKQKGMKMYICYKHTAVASNNSGRCLICGRHFKKMNKNYLIKSDIAIK